MHYTYIVRYRYQSNFVCNFVESDPENSIDSQAAEDEEDETSKKLKVETNRTNSLVSDAELESPCQDNVETCDSTTCCLDLLQSATEYTSESQEHHAVLCSENGADSGASNAPGIEAAAAMSSSCCTFAATATLPEELEISENTYYVYFSRIPPGKTSDPLALSDAAYKQREVNDISRAGEIMKSAFTNRTIIRLRDLGIAEEKCKKLAHLVMNGNKMKINADVDELHSTEDIRKQYRYWTEIESYQCLLISAPIDDDPAERRQEMKNFCLQAFPVEHFNAARLDRTVLWREVSNCTHVKH